MATPRGTGHRDGIRYLCIGRVSIGSVLVVALEFFSRFDARVEQAHVWN